jgi:hypothetical protein
MKEIKDKMDVVSDRLEQVERNTRSTKGNKDHEYD